jgi:hypothetical protein
LEIHDTNQHLWTTIDCALSFSDAKPDLWITDDEAEEDKRIAMLDV